MKRIVKFRVWSKIYDKFLEEPFRIDVTKPIAHLDYIFQEYTGREDKNGKEIYEGDIIKSEYDEELVYIRMAEAYSGAQLSLIQADGNLKSFYGGLPNISDYEIIGNILENPELIKL